VRRRRGHRHGALPPSQHAHARSLSWREVRVPKGHTLARDLGLERREARGAGHELVDGDEPRGVPVGLVVGGELGDVLSLVSSSFSFIGEREEEREEKREGSVIFRGLRFRRSRLRKPGEEPGKG
jgi:hypothetical protein